MTRNADAWRDWRRQAKARAPFVRRREHDRLQDRHEAVMDALHGRVPHAVEAPLLVRKPVQAGLAGEVCLFMTYAARPAIKGHVLHHVGHLLRAGIAVVLVVNTDLPLHEIDIPADLLERCAGVLVRSNQGLDFGAWGHAFSQADRSGWERLYLVNDSIVGPLAPQAFDAMIERIRAHGADHLGLTWNTQPVAHLQSYFLVFNRRVLESVAFQKTMTGIYSFPDKASVVDCYETRLTPQLAAQEFTCASVFPEVEGGLGDAGHLLLDAGAYERAVLPYVKVSLLRRFAQDPRATWVRRKTGADDDV